METAVAPTISPAPVIPRAIAVKSKPAQLIAQDSDSNDQFPSERALPLDPNALTQERIAAYQVALERIHFSCGFIDGDLGIRTFRMLCAFQASRNLPITGQLDDATREAIGDPGEPFFDYTVTAEDMSKIAPAPKGVLAQSKVPYLGYSDAWDMLREKFHCARAYIKALNPDVTEVNVGTVIIGPKVFPAEPLPQIVSVRVLLSQTAIQGLDSSGKIVFHFPCSIAKDKNKRPNGELTVKNIVPNPNYTFDPNVLVDVAQAEDVHQRLVIPPGPRDPVGVAWIGLSLPGYGMHGTPEPEDISRTQSHGCFRLANWNAEKLLGMVHIGMPVEVDP